VGLAVLEEHVGGLIDERDIDSVTAELEADSAAAVLIFDDL
jgi:hypothetical protein